MNDGVESSMPFGFWSFDCGTSSFGALMAVLPAKSVAMMVACTLPFIFSSMTVPRMMLTFGSVCSQMNFVALSTS